MEPSEGSSSPGITPIGAAMAAMTITDKVHYEALYDLCSFLAVPELRILRLVNKKFCQAASRHLFRTLVIRPRRQIIDNIVNLSKNKAFAGGVREIVWETAHRHDPLRPLEDVGGSEFKGWLDEDFGASLASQTNLDQIAETEGRLMSSAETLTELVTAFKEFTGLKIVNLCSWARQMSTLKALWEKDDGRLDQEDSKPGRLPTFFNRETEARRQTEALCLLLRALSAAKRSITELYIDPTLDDRVTRELYHRERAGNYDVINQHMLVFWNELTDSQLLELVQPLQNLEYLFVTLQSWPRSIVGSLWTGELSRFLSKLPKLEQLAISPRIVLKERADAGQEDVDEEGELMHFYQVARIPLDKVFHADHMFSHLRVLDLDSFVLEGSELAQVLARHQTLEYVNLHDIILFGTFDKATLEPGKPSFDRLQKPLKERHEVGSDSANPSDPDDTSAPADSTNGSGAATSANDDMHWDHPHWDLVVRACQTLSELDGVNFGKPSECFFDEQGLALRMIFPDSTAIALEEAAMNGRPNKLF